MMNILSILNQTIIKKIKKIRVLLIDVDCVLTDCGMYYDKIGDIMKKIGFSASPNNGIKEIKKESDYVCELNGREGVLREVADLVLRTQKL